MGTCDKYMYGYKYECNICSQLIKPTNICSQLIKPTHLHEVISLNLGLGKSFSNPMMA